MDVNYSWNNILICAWKEGNELYISLLARDVVVAGRTLTANPELRAFFDANVTPSFEPDPFSVGVPKGWLVPEISDDLRRFLNCIRENADCPISFVVDGWYRLLNSAAPFIETYLYIDDFEGLT